MQILINDTAVLLLSEIQKNTSLETLIKSFCIKYRQDHDSASKWISAFIKELLDLGLITTNKTPNEGFLRVIDAGKTISPSSADLEVTSACNLTCPFCYAHGGESKQFFPFNSIEKLFDELIDIGVLSIGLTGGEFFLHPKALEILSLAVERFPQIGLLTNVTLITKQAIELIAQHSNQIVMSISVDSVRPGYHDSLRGMKNSFNLTTTSIKQLSESGISVRVSSVISEENKWEIADLAELAKSLGAASFCFSFVEEVGRGVQFNKTSKLIPDEDYSKFLTDTILKYKNYMPFIHKLGKRENKMNCGAGTSRITIGSDGYIRPCLMLNKTPYFGNVLRQSLKEILATNETFAILNLPEPSEAHGCSPKCKYFHECTHCMARGFAKGISHSKEGVSYCAWIEANHLENLARTFDVSNHVASCDTTCDIAPLYLS